MRIDISNIDKQIEDQIRRLNAVRQQVPLKNLNSYDALIDVLTKTRAINRR